MTENVQWHEKTVKGSDVKKIIDKGPEYFYETLKGYIIECTNGREEKKYALYANLEGQIFCREFAEFIKKFTKM